MTRFGGEVEQAYEAARSSTRARAVLTLIIIFIVFSSVVAILWVGSHDVLTGSISPGRLGQFVLYAAFAATGARPAQRGLGRSLGRLRRRRTAVRNPARQIADRGAGLAGRAAAAGARRCRVRECQLCLSDAAGCTGGRRRLAVGQGRREGRDRRSLRRRQEHAVSSAAAVLRSGLGHDRARRRADQVGRSARVAFAHRAGAAGLGGVRRDRARKHPLRPARCQRCRGRARRRSRPCQRIHPPSAGGFRGAARRARRDAVGRPAPAHRDCPRHPARCAAVAARRGDLVARCRKPRRWCRPRWKN